ncbi:1-aminocyclopropane-1-carboxylate synthase CMW33, partial [Cucurbita argyrosperma subsp. argyrosperma]
MGFHQIDERNQALLSKIAVDDGHGENSPYFDGWKAYDNDPFHPENNPLGVIQMGLAENQLSFGMIVDWLRKHPEASICTPEGLERFKSIANFQDYHGLPEFRNAIASFMGKIRGGRVKFDPSRIVMGGGATGASETVIFCLADPGDAFLVPSPYYAAFDRDIKWRTRAQIIRVHCNSSNNFQVTKAALEIAYKKAQEANIKVKGVIITNPSNPLGTTYDRDTLKTLVTFVNQHDIHLICDEIYSATVFKAPTFTSIAEIVEQMEHCKKELIHILYSLSKDMGLPGFRVGIIYSYNDLVVRRARQIVELWSSLVPRLNICSPPFAFPTRGLCRQISCRELEAPRGEACKAMLEFLCGWIYGGYLKDQTFKAEMELWRVIINEVKLNVSPGSSFHVNEPGWFRVCFANMDDNTVDVALNRIHSFVKNIDKKKDNTVAMPSKTRRRENKLRLSFSFSGRRYDEGNVLNSPHTMSPHSPLVIAKN